ncbi:hypothetical protein BH09BAC6_BH09BAC6_18830 [soil metagenome]|jgi:hypothetical protein
MRLNTLVSFLGFVILAAATYCPMLRPFHLFNFDVYGLNKAYGVTILLVAVIGILGTFFNQIKVTRLASFASIVLVVLLYVAVYAKIRTSFSFIPFHAIDAFLTRQIKFKWGWYVLFGGSLLSLAGVFTKKTIGFK